MKKVFIVEDDQLIALDLISILEKHKYVMYGHVNNGAEALELIPQLQPDVILMDINIVGPIDGIEVAQSLSAKVNAPIIFTSALSDEETLRRAKLVRPFGYVVKPFDDVDIITAIEIGLTKFEEVSSGSQNLDEDYSEILLNDIEGSDQLRVEQIKTLPIFSELSDEHLTLVAQSSVIKSFEAGENISDKMSDGFIVLQGRVAIISTTIDGKDLISELLGPQDTYGLLMLHKEIAEKVYARCQSDSKILVIKNELYKVLLNKSLPFNHMFIDALLRQQAKSISITQALAYSKVEHRIINAIIALMPSFGKKVAGSQTASRLFLTRKELADFTGTTPETAIRVTKSLERRGLLDLSKPGIIKLLDAEKLKEELIP